MGFPLQPITFFVCFVSAADFDTVDWKMACVEIDRSHRSWSSDFTEEMNCILSADDFVVDAVHLMQVLCLL